MSKKRFLCAAAVGFMGLTAGNASAALVYATTGSTISRFDDASLGTVTTVPVVGLEVGETLVGIDVRPGANGPGGFQPLFGIGSTSRVYTVNPFTGMATQVSATAFAPGLNGTSFGMDFN